jgi:hypothetical protein
MPGLNSQAAMAIAWAYRFAVSKYEARCLGACSKPEKASLKLTWHGHSAFRIEAVAAKILIDPFLSDNPSWDKGWSGYRTFPASAYHFVERPRENNSRPPIDFGITVYKPDLHTSLSPGVSLLDHFRQDSCSIRSYRRNHYVRNY